MGLLRADPLPIHERSTQTAALPNQKNTGFSSGRVPERLYGPRFPTLTSPILASSPRAYTQNQGNAGFPGKDRPEKLYDTGASLGLPRPCTFRAGHTFRISEMQNSRGVMYRRCRMGHAFPHIAQPRGGARCAPMPDTVEASLWFFPHATLSATGLGNGPADHGMIWILDPGMVWAPDSQKGPSLHPPLWQ